MKVVKFKYYDEFHCIGSECPDSCCQQWTITFSKREYLDYKKAKCSPELKSVIDNAFTRIRDAKKLGLTDDEKANYVFIKLKENGDCPFHDTDGLCMVQKELGEQALSSVCTVFPRLYANIGQEAYLFSCNVTCPHVIDLLISHSEGLEIVEEEYDGSINFLNKGLYSATPTPKDWIGYPYFWAIKSAEIDILQNRNFTIQERLLILGFFCKKADEYLENSEGQKIEGLYNMLLDNEFCKKIADSLKAPQSDDEAAAKSMDIFRVMLNDTRRLKCSKLQKWVFEQVADRFKINSEEGDEYISQISFDKATYNENVGIFRKIESERPYILENLLVNEAFIQAPVNGLFKNFFALAIFYNTLKICVPAFLKEGWTDKDLALALTYSSKMVLNSHYADKAMPYLFEQTGSFDLPHAAFLIS